MPNLQFESKSFNPSPNEYDETMMEGSPNFVNSQVPFFPIRTKSLSGNQNIQFPVNPQSRSASAPVPRQNPTVLLELAGMMKNTVSVSPNGLYLAPPVISPRAQSPQNINQPKAPVAIRKVPVRAVQEPEQISNIVNRSKPNIGGSGAFATVNRR